MSKVEMPSGADVVGDPSESQQQELTVDHRPQMSIDQLLEAIKGANGMPVLLVSSGDGRLTAVAVDGLPNRNNKGSAEKIQQDFRAWLLVLASLIATVTFTAGLAPPGGFWSADDKAKGYVAGDPVMGNKSPRRYSLFHYSNTTAFFTSLLVIGVLANSKKSDVLSSKFFRYLVGVCIFHLGGSYMSGTWVGFSLNLYNSIICFATLLIHISLPWLLGWTASINPDIPARTP